MKFEYKKGSLIMLSGIPGSGKSTFAKKFFPLDVIISPDELRQRYFGDEYIFAENNYIGISNYQSNGNDIFTVAHTLARSRCEDGLSTVIDALNLDDGSRKRWIELGNWSRVYTITFDTKNGEERNLARRNSGERGYVPESIMQKKKERFQKGSRIKNNTVISADEIDTVEEIYEYLELTPERPILVYGDVHGIRNFSTIYFDMQSRYTRSGCIPLSLFVGDLVDRGDASVDALCLVMQEVKNGNARLLMGNHEYKLLRNINTYLEKGIIEDEVEARYRTIKAFVELEKKDGIYNGPVSSLKGENFNLARIKNFLEALPFYKYIRVDGGARYLVTHGPVLPPPRPGDLKFSNAIFGSEQLRDNLKCSKEQAENNNRQFLEALTPLHAASGIKTIFGHVDMNNIISSDSAFISLEGRVDQGGTLKVLILEKDADGTISENIQTFPSGLNYIRGQADTGWYGMFDALDAKLISRDTLGDMTLFKYSRKVFYDHAWGKNTTLTNSLLLKARGIVFDRLGNVISYPFDKVFNLGEAITNREGKVTQDNTLPEGSYEFIEKMNGFLGIISQDFYSRNKLLIHTAGSLSGKYRDYIADMLTSEQALALTKFFKKHGKHTCMFEVVHPDDPHIIKYDRTQQGLYLIGIRCIQGESLDDMKLFSENEVDTMAKEMGFLRPRHHIETYTEFQKRKTMEQVEGYMVRDITTGTHLVKIKFPYYLITKFLSRMNDQNFSFLFSNPDAFIQKHAVDEEFFELIAYIASHREQFEGVSDLERGEKIRAYFNSL